MKAEETDGGLGIDRLPKDKRPILRATRTFSGLIPIFLLVLPYRNLPGQDKVMHRASNPIQQFSIPDQFKLLNINALTDWVRNNGVLSHSPKGEDGGIFPRGISAVVIYSDGFIWGGKAYIDSGKTIPAPFDQTIRVGGATYSSGARPGRVTGEGAQAVPVDPESEESRVYRIRRDYYSVSDAELRVDAAETFEIEPDSVRLEQMQEVYDSYDRDWREWPVPFGAPFIDRNGNGVYDPPPPFGPGFSLEDLIPGGYDEPGLYAGSMDGPADQVIWCVFNDLWRSQRFDSEPLGFELQFTQWAFKSNYSRRQGIFYRKLRMINKGGVETDDRGSRGSFWIDSMYVGQWSDADIGNWQNDLVGCDTMLNMSFYYNAGKTDSEFAAYGLPPPSLGYIFVQGPRKRSPGDTANFDNKILPEWKNLPMTSFVYIPPVDPYSDPCAGYICGATYWYKSLRGYQQEPGPDMLFDFPPGIEPSTFPLAGDPVTSTGHIDSHSSDYSQGGGDRRTLMSSGPFSLAPGDTQEVVIAVVTGLSADRLSSLAYMKYAARRIRAYYPSQAVFSEEDYPDNLPEPVIPNYYSLYQNYPNPFQNGTQIRYTLPQAAQVRIAVYDLLGREVVLLENSQKGVGNHNLTWDGLDSKGRPVPSGIYFYKLQANHIEISRKLFLLR